MNSRRAPPAFYGATSVWAGSRMVVWGGLIRNGYFDDPTNRGGAYDPDQDTWSATWTKGAPLPRWQHSAVSTGPKVMVWGGAGKGAYADGGIYDPATDTWEPILETGAPTPRTSATAVWTGTKMIVWGGAVIDNSGGVYDPVTRRWTPTATTRPPSP